MDVFSVSLEIQQVVDQVSGGSGQAESEKCESGLKKYQPVAKRERREEQKVFSPLVNPHCAKPQRHLPLRFWFETAAGRSDVPAPQRTEQPSGRVYDERAPSDPPDRKVLAAISDIVESSPAETRFERFALAGAHQIHRPVAGDDIVKDT